MQMLERRRLAVLALLLAATPLAAWRAQQPATVESAARPQAAQAVDADKLVREFRFGELVQTIAAMPSSADRDYFAGVLANRAGRVERSVPLLERALPRVKASRADRAAIGLRALADDYVKLYRYADAARTLAELLDTFRTHFDKAELESTMDDYAALRLLTDAPPQTISFSGPVDLATHRNRMLDTIDATLFVNGVRESWILDTGANFTAVTASFARRLGVQVSKEKAQTKGITGAENDLRAAILPELHLGGAIVRNVVLIVLDDASFNVPTGASRYQINAVLGYPVLHALGRVTFTDDGHLLAGPDSPSAAGGATLYMKELMPLLECTVANRQVLFSFDTGADRSLFSVRYYREFPEQFRGLSPKPYAFGGAGGIRRLMAHYLPQAELGIGATTATLRNVPVVPELGTDTDKFFGNLGRDVTDAYRTFTIDFAAMRLRLGERRR